MVAYAPTELVQRDQWGALPAVPSRLAPVQASDRHKIGATYHHTTGATLGNPNFSQWVQSIQRYHIDTLGYGDIAYGMLIDPDGRAYIGRDENVYVGAHAASHDNVANRLTRGVALLGDYTSTVPTFAMQHAALWVIELLRFVGDGLLAWCHREWSQYGPPALPTACPGDAGDRFVVQVVRPYASTLAR